MTRERTYKLLFAAGNAEDKKADFPVPSFEECFHLIYALQHRGRTQREIAENIPVIVDAASNTQEITLKTTNKTYTFDRVFGQETTQQHMYDDVVSPILQEMLMG
jgi:Kinesin motor domain